MKNNHQTKMKVEVITRKSKDKWTPLDDVRVFEWRLGEKGVKSKDWQKRPALARLNNVIIHSAPRTIIVGSFTGFYWSYVKKAGLIGDGICLSEQKDKNRELVGMKKYNPRYFYLARRTHRNKEVM